MSLQRPAGTAGAEDQLRFPKPVKAKKTPKRKKRHTPKRVEKETPAEKAWKAWVHQRPCAGIRSFTNHGNYCYLNVQQAHLRDMTGLGLKESNYLSIPLCMDLHSAHDEARGPFAPMGREGRKHWMFARLIEERAQYSLEHNGAHPWDEEELP